MKHTQWQHLTKYAIIPTVRKEKKEKKKTSQLTESKSKAMAVT